MNIEITDPYTGQRYKTFPQSSPEQVATALQNGAAYFETALQQSPQERAAQLLTLAQLFRDRQDELATEATHNMGKLFREGQGEAQAAANIAEYYAQHGPAFLQDRPYNIDGQHASLEYTATGIIVSVEPWNFPYTQVMRVFAPNFILGNPIILKHAAIVGGCAALFEQLVAAAGMPTGAFKNLFLSHDQVDKLLADPRVQGVALTGSEAAGRSIAAMAGHNLIKSTLELGGSDAFVVLDDADIPAAVEGATVSRLRNAGQVCTSAKRYIVRKEVAADFIAGIKHNFQTQILGDPSDPATTLAPLSSRSARDTLQKQVDAAVQEGAQIVVDGGAVAGTNFFKPIVLSNITPNNPASQTEFFGPVAQLYIVDSDEEAIRVANATPYGLAGAVYSQDIERAQNVARQMITGQVFLNRPSVGVPQLPFGGVKNSGYGREMSDLGILEFANQKIVVH
ncbi:NAD-dependent aldehyde dehydrogenase [Lactobacillus selangorensis]|uniref:NAD-dependent aldehyde dehydrogenase n=1 Tax=Lactobacillus selangorensis TaxID=81857 RepID=A0A0R2FK67_9LACO|nr:aldehyde dehydrogenase family protein [Lactobacillus selangorensis]KRN28654.1 NAD-dependent aldehyde dehydrogenase [Lactobacillus selangorensis]KRN32936.1 NAD-dependent aldehyde dehydrogenase [Lactobacillus selangorensis]